jgi:hypothetical protein
MQTIELSTPTMNEPSQPDLPHSGLGVVALVISLFAGVLIFVTFIVAGVLHESHRGMPGPYPGAALVGFSCMGLFALEVVALGLGIGALCERHRKKLSAILAVVFSSAIVVVTVVMICLGLYMAHRHTGGV